MNKGFLFTVATFMLMISLVFLLGRFSERQASYQDLISYEFGSSKVMYAWGDVQEDLDNILRINVTKDGKQVTIEDMLPAEGIGDFLENYGYFVENYYETKDVDLKFLSPGGTEMDLGDLGSKLTIHPFNIQYGYLDYGKNVLQVTSPTENVTEIQTVSLDFDLTNDTIDDINWSPSPGSCTSGDVCLYFYIEVDDQVLRNAQTPVDKKSVLHINCAEGGPSCVTIEIGETNPSEEGIQNVFEVTIKTGKVENLGAETSLLLKTSEFSINCMAKLKAMDVNYEIKKEDWL